MEKIDNFEQKGFVRRSLDLLLHKQEYIDDCVEKIEHFKYLLDEFSNDFKDAIIPTVTLEWAVNLERYKNRFKSLTGVEYNSRDAQRYIKTDKINKND
jgi:hypothetical protein